MNIAYRPFALQDLETLRGIMVDAFDGVSIDQGMEAICGKIGGHDWRWRKGRPP